MAQSLRWITCAALCCCISFAFAQTFTYRVEIDAARPYQKLLEENVDITKWQGNPEMTLDFLKSVFSKTPEQIKTLMASAGYYDPQIDSSLTEVAGVWVALLNNLVEPTMGSVPSYKALAIIVLGGLGSVPGTLADDVPSD